MKSFYWRSDSFETLQKVIGLLEKFPEWEGYARYCEDRERGLRKKALIHLENFIRDMNSGSLADRIAFVDWIEKIRLDNSGTIDLIPTPLRKDLITPTLEDWIALEPENPIPYRWLNTIESLIKAIRLDAEENVSKKRLYAKIVGHVDCNQHELRNYLYLGSPHKDLENLLKLRALVNDTDLTPKSQIEINARIAICERYIEFEKSEMFGVGNFLTFLMADEESFDNISPFID